MDQKELQDPVRFANQNHFMLYNHICAGQAGDQWAEIYLDVVEDSTNPYGQVHGGAMFTMADCCAGRVARLDGRLYVTQDASVQFIHNVSSGRITAHGTVLNRGRKICLVEVKITDQGQKLLFNGIFSMYCIQV